MDFYNTLAQPFSELLLFFALSFMITALVYWVAASFDKRPNRPAEADGNQAALAAILLAVLAIALKYVTS